MPSQIIRLSWVPILLVLVTFPAKAQSGTERVGGNEAVANEVLVKFREGNTAGLAQALETSNIDGARVVGANGWVLLHSRTHSTASLIRNFQPGRQVAFVEPNYVVHANLIPDDPLWASLWGMVKISAPDAWDITTGSTSSVVAVVDTGISYNHEDLAGNVWSAPIDFTVTIGGVDITCAAGTHGFNAIARTCDPFDDHGHGTQVSGIAGAVGNNGLGVVGVNWTAGIIASKFLNAGGAGTLADAIDAIEFTVQAKSILGEGANVRVLSNSWGGGGFSQALLDEIVSARDHDMLFVAAVGSSSSDMDLNPFYPASYDVENVIAVMATTESDERAPFSNWGRNSVHLGAPGVVILSTTRTGYANFSGTSPATAHVSGAAGLVLSACDLDTPTLKQVLLDNVDLIDALDGLTVTGGRLNVYQAVAACVSP
jgi:subtilisin family serine protease